LSGVPALSATLPIPGSGGSGRWQRIRAAAEEVRRELARREAVRHAAAEGALERRRRSEAGEPVRGRIPKGRTSCRGARAPGQGDRHSSGEAGPVRRASRRGEKADGPGAGAARGLRPGAAGPNGWRRRPKQQQRRSRRRTDRLPRTYRRWWRRRPTSSRGSCRPARVSLRATTPSWR
jgi:hypothetical protein